MSKITYHLNYVMVELLSTVRTTTETILNARDGLEIFNALKKLEKRIRTDAEQYVPFTPMHMALYEWADSLYVAQVQMHDLHLHTYLVKNQTYEDYISDLREGALEHIDWVREDLGVEDLTPQPSSESTKRAVKRAAFNLWFDELAAAQSPAAPPVKTVNVLCNKDIPFAVLESTPEEARATAILYTIRDPDLFCDVTVVYGVREIQPYPPLPRTI